MRGLALLLAALACLFAVPAEANNKGRLHAAPRQGAWLSSAKLSWAPPTNISPVLLTASTGYYAPTLDGGRDYVISCPSTMRSADMLLAGTVGDQPRNITLIGCAMTGRLMVMYFSGVAHIEGVFINGPTTPKDGIDCGGGAATSGVCRFQNVLVTGINGSTLTGHADTLQLQGPVAGLQIDKYTGDSNYQGLFISPQQATGYVAISRANLFHNAIPNADGNPSQLFWFLDSDQSGTSGTGKFPEPIACIACYAKVRSDLTFANKGYYPVAGTTANGFSVAPQTGDAGASVYWTGYLQTTNWWRSGALQSAVIAGDAPGGDFVPVSTIWNGSAMVYASPGYLP